MESIATAFRRFRLLLVAIAIATAIAQSAPAIGETRLPISDEAVELRPLPDRQGRRHLLKKSRCLLFRKCATYRPTADHPRGYHRDSWSCKLARADSEPLGGIEFVDIVEESRETVDDIQFLDVRKSRGISATLANATSGASILSISQAVLDVHGGEPSMYIPAQAHVHVLNGGHSFDGHEIEGVDEDLDTHRRRHLTARTMGTMNTLMIRLVDSNGIEPVRSTEDLINDLYQDEVSLKTQMGACSYNKLTIQPFNDLTPSGEFIQNGIVDIQMDYDTAEGNKTNSDGMNTAATKAAKDFLGDLTDPMFDLVLFCFPPAKSKLSAFAYGNGRYSFYHSNWCGYVASQMHEVGHNLGLAHSGQTGEDEYGDSTGYMGPSKAADDHRQCYNPQKSYQLRWYEDRVKSINPLNEQLPMEFTLNGVADYANNPEAYIVVRLEQADKEDYYIGYNRATGVNADTNEDADKVTVISKDSGGPYEYGQSTKVASLAPGQMEWIYNFNGSGRYIQIAFIGITNSGDARVDVREDVGWPLQSTVSCQTFTVEVFTDNSPQNYYWYFSDKDDWGRVGGKASPYNNPNEFHAREVCLPRGPRDKTYRFSFEDVSGTGMGADGYYRVLDKDKNELFSGGSDFALDRTWNHVEVGVDADPDQEPDDSNSDGGGGGGGRRRCKDETRKKFKVEGRSRKKKRCKYWARKNKCNKQIISGRHRGDQVEDVCKKSCKACSN